MCVPIVQEIKWTTHDDDDDDDVVKDTERERYVFEFMVVIDCVPWALFFFLNACVCVCVCLFFSWVRVNQTPTRTERISWSPRK